jgi:hypothetical protein
MFQIENITKLPNMTKNGGFDYLTIDLGKLLIDRLKE